MESIDYPEEMARLRAEIEWRQQALDTALTSIGELRAERERYEKALDKIVGMCLDAKGADRAAKRAMLGEIKRLAMRQLARKMATNHLLYENSSQKFFLEVHDSVSPPRFVFSIAELLDGPDQPLLTLAQAQEISRRITEIIQRAERRDAASGRVVEDC